MSNFKKDYKALYEATKADLKDQINYSLSLEDDIEDLKEKIREINIDLSRRERIAIEVHRQGWDASTADRMLTWIAGKAPVAILKPKKAKKTGKRKYTKKSKFWAKKKK